MITEENAEEADRNNRVKISIRIKVDFFKIAPHNLCNVPVKGPIEKGTTALNRHNVPCFSSISHLSKQVFLGQKRSFLKPRSKPNQQTTGGLGEAGGLPGFFGLLKIPGQALLCPGHPSVIGCAGSDWV
jgi:hypothetical protein